MTTERRCPECSSLVRPDAEWCSLCHADLRTEEQKAAARPAPEWVEPVLDPDPSPEVAAPDWTAELAAAAAPRGRHARPAGSTDGAHPADPSDPAAPARQVAGPVPAGPAVGLGSTSAMSADADAALAKAGVDVQSMLSLLAAGEPDALSPITGRLSSKGSRAVAATIATVALIAVAILTMFVIGSFIH